jgi:Domain of unknown function (DUF4499)
MNDKDTPSLLVHPHWGWFVLLDGGLALLCSLSFSDRAHGGMARFSPLPRQRFLRRLFVLAVAIHVFEAIGAARGARRRGLPVRVWAMQTLVVGFPSLLALRHAPEGRET